MKQQTGNMNRAEKKPERLTKAEKVYNALQKDKRRAASSQKKEASA